MSLFAPLCLPLAHPLVLLFSQAGLAGSLLRLREFFEQLRSGHGQRGEPLEPSLQRRVVEGIGIELLVDPFLKAYLADAFDVARSRAEAKAIEGMQDNLIFAQLGDGQALQDLAGLRRLVLPGLLVLSRGEVGRGKHQRGQQQRRDYANERAVLSRLRFAETAPLLGHGYPRASSRTH